MEHNYGENFKRYRKLAGFTQEEFAEHLNMSTNMVSRIEQGRNYPSVESLVEISKTLNVPLDYFFSDESRENQLIALALYIEKLKELSDPDLKRLTFVLRTLFEFDLFEKDTNENVEKE